MQSTQPVGSPLGLLLLVAGIYLVFKSPKKLQTFGRMAGGFVGTVLLIGVTGAVLRRGDPEAIGRIAGLIGLLAAVIVGWWHTRSLQRAGKGAPVKPGS